MKKYILAIDLGTTLIKLVLFDRELRIVSEHSRQYNLETEKEFIEFDAESYWKTIEEGISELLQKSRIRSGDIASIALSSQAETLVLLDKDYKPVRKAISWLDNRSKKECQQIKNSFDQQQGYKVTGQPGVITTWPITKILWIKNNERKVFDCTAKFLLLKDYIVYKFTGEFISEYTIYNFSYYFDIISKQYWDQMLEFAGLDQEKLPQLVEPGSNIPRLRKQVIDKFDFGPDINLNLGALDQMAGMIGVGNITEGIVSETTGTVLAICTLLGKPMFSSARIPCHYSAIKDKYILLPICESGGITLEWFKNNFYEGKSYSYIDQQVSRISPGCNDLLFLPYITGVNAPEYNDDARGVFYGITIKHHKHHFARAILESIAFILRKNLDFLESELSLDIKEIISLGGGANSTVWNQIKSDVLNREINITSNSQPTALGAAMLAAVDMGWYGSLESIADNKIELEKTFKPKNSEKYTRSYELFIRLYKALEPVFGQ
ncbi:MAG: FGGY family carbohydrate kinase [Actinomycetota bacterium]|nr:FGGY family carbohydrate kinase [Actinomycetota bacterium]